MVSYLGVVRTVMMADTAQFNRAVTGASMQFRAAAAKMRSDAQSLVGISGALNLAITIPAIMAARSITKLGLTYESNMQKIKHVAGMTQKQLETLNKAQIQLSKDTRTRPSELSRVGYMAAQAQILTPRAIREVQKAVAMAQKVQPGDAPTEAVAAGLLTNLKAFKIPVQDSVKTMAEMIKTVDLGSISWEQYSKRITQVAAVAANIGGKSSFKNMNIALALATQGGVQGAEAATALRNLYLRIYDQSKKKNSVLNQAAVSAKYKDAADMFETGAGGSITKYMQMLSSGYGTARGATAAGFLRREITSALTLMNASFDEWQRYEKEYDSAFPDFKRRYEEFLKSPIGILQGVQAAFERVKLSAFTAIGPMIIKFLEGLEWALNKFANLPNIDKQFIALTIGLASLGTALASLWGVIQSITLTRRLNKILGAGAASSIGPLGAIDPYINASKIATAKLAKEELAAKTAAVKLAQAEINAKIAATKLAQEQTAAAMAESKLRFALGKEREFAERAINKAKKAEAATAAKQAANAATHATASGMTQAATRQAEATILGARRAQLAALSLGNAANVKGLLEYGAGIGLPPAPGPFSPLMPGYSGPLKRGLPNINRPPKMLNRRRLLLLGYSGMVPYASRALSNRTDAGRSRYTRIPFGNIFGADNIFDADDGTDMEMGADGVWREKRNLIGGGQDLAKVPSAGAGKSTAVAGRAVKPPRMPRTGFFGKGSNFAKISKSIFVALGGMLKFASILYIIVSAFRGLGRVLEVTLWPVIQGLLPSGVSLKDAFSALLSVLKQVDAFIVNVFMLAFAGVVGTFENLFGTIIGGVMLVISKIKELWFGLSIWVRDSWVGRKFGIDPSDEELAKLQALKDERGKKTDYWAEYMAGQFKGMFGGEQSAVARILADIEEKRKAALIKEEEEPDEPEDKRGIPAAPSISLPNIQSGAPGFFEYGTSAGYEARIAAADAMYDLMKELKVKTTDLLAKIQEELETANAREAARDADVAAGVTG